MAQNPKARPGGRRRPPADIELNATEVPAEAAMPASSAAEPQPEPIVVSSAQADSAPDMRVEPQPEAAPEARPSETTVAAEPPSPQPERQSPSPPRRTSDGVIVRAIVAGAVAGAAFGTLAALFLPVLKGRPKTIDLAPVETRLSVLEKRDPAPEASRVQALGEQVAELQRQLASQRDALAEASKTIASVRQTATAGVANEIAPLAARLQGLEQSGQALASKVSGVASGQSTSVAASLLAASQALSASFERGAPFQPELKAVEAFAGNSDKLGALKPYAAKGAPTVRALTDRFRALRPSLVAAEAPPASNGILDRIAASASTIVKVRPVGAQPGTDTASVLSRIDAALQRDDLDLAVKEAAGLPEKPAQAAAAWVNDVKARQTAVAALTGLENDALQVISAASR